MWFIAIHKDRKISAVYGSTYLKTAKTRVRDIGGYLIKYEGKSKNIKDIKEYIDSLDLENLP